LAQAVARISPIHPGPIIPTLILQLTVLSLSRMTVQQVKPEHDANEPCGSRWLYTFPSLCDPGSDFAWHKISPC